MYSYGRTLCSLTTTEYNSGGEAMPPASAGFRFMTTAVVVVLSDSTPETTQLLKPQE